MRNSRYREDRRVGLDAELFYFFINFRDLFFDQLDLAYEMFYLDLFRSGGDANGILCSELKLFGSQRNTIAPAGGFKAITKRADIRRSDFFSAGKFSEDFHVHNAVFGLEKAAVLWKNDVDTLLKSVGIDIQLFFQIVMMTGKLPLFIAERLTFVVEKVKALLVIGESSRFQENLTGVFGDDGEGVVSFADVNSD